MIQNNTITIIIYEYNKHIENKKEYRDLEMKYNQNYNTYKN